MAHPDQLDGRSRAALVDSANVLFVSAVSAWEISINVNAERLNFPIGDFEWIVGRLRAVHLPITSAHGVEAGRLPLHHRDPFDRLLVAQAYLEGLTLMTTDTAILRYDVPVFGRAPA